MDEHFADDDLRALQGADPAAVVEAPQPLRDRVAAIPEDTVDAGPVALRPRRRWLLPVAAATTVIAAVGGGYVWGAGGIDLGPAPVPLAVETGTPDDPAAPIGSLDGGAENTGGEDTGAGTGDSFSATDQTAVGASVAYPWGYPVGRKRFIVPEFETTPAHAEVYAVDGRAQYSAEDASRMAAALGVEGDVHELEGAPGTWVVGDISGRHLSIHPWSGGSLQYSSGLADPWSACDRIVSPRYNLDGAAQSVLDAYQTEVQQCFEGTPLPTEEQARDALRTFLAATGVDEEATQITVTVEPKGGSRTAAAKAAWVVGSNATELVTEVWVSSQGIMGGSGPIGDVVSLGEYPIVSPAEGAARLNDPAYSPRLVSWPESDIGYPEYTEPTAPPEVPDAGSPVPWSIAEREIVAARLGLALLHGPDGQPFLAPAYEFTADDGTVWSVMALSEEDLDTSTTDPGLYGGWW